MRDILFQLMKWTVSVFFTITGVYCLMIVQQYDNIQPLFISILSFGIVYWMYKTKEDIPKTVMFMTLFVVIASYWAMLYAPYYLDLHQRIFTGSQYLTWLAWAFVGGWPITMITFWKTS